MAVGFQASGGGGVNFGGGLGRKGVGKSSKIMEKKTAGTDFLIDVEHRKVVISNRSGNYNSPAALH